ncbi:MAG: roadblock/LC7 domain-containing protein [Gammaproteobacteria bacterium]|nr:roadblock/LC7 domain-containing protein [Gammaproteobacteria bacterium]
MDKETLGKTLRPLLRGLNGTSLDIEASAVMTKDGLTISAVLGEAVDADRLGAMCATMLSLADTTSRELARGDLEQVLIKGSTGYVLIVEIGENAVLAVVAKATINLGMVFLEAKTTARKAMQFF